MDIGDANLAHRGGAWQPSIGRQSSHSLYLAAGRLPDKIKVMSIQPVSSHPREISVTEAIEPAYEWVKRAYPLYFLAQFGGQYNVFPAPPAPPVAG